MPIKLNLETKQFIRKLGRRGNALQVVAAEAINESAEGLEINYKRRLQRNQRLRARKFSLGSVKTFKANPIRRSGEPRQLHDINAITGVRKMKGGRQHYLAKLEEGRVQRGNRKTKGRVPIPLTAARTSQNINKPISSPNRLLKGDTQTLIAGGKTFGFPTDRRSNGQPWKSTRQKFAALYKYKRTGTGNLVGDLKKPFFFTDNKNKLGIFKFISGVAKKIRNLEDTTVKTPKQPNFRKSVDTITPGRIQKTFNRKAQRKLSGVR